MTTVRIASKKAINMPRFGIFDLSTFQCLFAGFDDNFQSKDAVSA
jgi:hypothetical protein